MKKKIDWPTALFLILTPIISIFVFPLYYQSHELNWLSISLLPVFLFLANMSITAGYHRFFSHRTYKAKSWVKLMYLFFGAASFQGSALKWGTDHRRHHAKVDTDEDPYSIQNGFFYAHMGWLLIEDDPRFRNQWAKDLLNDKAVFFQHRYYYLIAILIGFILPGLIASLWGDFWGGFLWGGLLRIVIGHHSTFLINSACHMWGKRGYSQANSARDNWFLAFLTYGEGYHNFHHQFSGDYRNGIRWYHWDPTKWLIRLMSFFGQTYKLKRVPPVELLKAQLQNEQIELAQRGLVTDRLEQLRHQIVQAQIRFRELKKEYSIMKSDLHLRSSERLTQLKLEIRLAKLEFQFALRKWRAHTAALQSASV